MTVLTGTTVTAISRAAAGIRRLRVEAVTASGEPIARTRGHGPGRGRRPPGDQPGGHRGGQPRRPRRDPVDRGMRTGLPGVYAAGDCVVTHHRLLEETYLPLGTTAHKQGRVAGENAAGGHREFAGSLGTQVVKIFDHAAARTGLRDHEATAAGYDPVTVACEADDHKAYYPGSHRIHMRFTGDRAPACSSASSSSATSTPRSPSASTSPPPPSTTA